VLTETQIDYLMPEQGYIASASAVISLDEPTRGEVPTYHRVQFQVRGLDAVAGIAPLKSMSWPKLKGGYLNGTFTAEGNPQSSQVWADEDIEFRLGYKMSARIMDPYSYRIGFSPVVDIEASRAFDLRQWVDEWVVPTRRIISIATGAAQDLTFLSASRSAVDGGSPPDRGQVFGSGITQTPYESSFNEVRNYNSVLMLKVDGVSLLDMVRQWQRLTVARHPLIETYGAMLTARDQHPRSRYLLLIQAVEGMYGFETKGDREQRETAFQEKRKNVLSTVDGHLTPSQRRFLGANLARTPRVSLDNALHKMMSDLPGDPLAKIANTDLITAVKRDCPAIATTEGAMRVVRNDLAHGNRGYPPQHLHEVVGILERVVRAHALRILGATSASVERVLTQAD
jgi:hypothetical protein